jgi:hypothetical protein
MDVDVDIVDSHIPDVDVANVAYAQAVVVVGGEDGVARTVE